jgi:hypothetical protein
MYFKLFIVINKMYDTLTVIIQIKSESYHFKSQSDLNKISYPKKIKSSLPSVTLFRNFSERPQVNLFSLITVTHLKLSNFVDYYNIPKFKII